MVDVSFAVMLELVAPVKVVPPKVSVPLAPTWSMPALDIVRLPTVVSVQEELTSVTTPEAADVPAKLSMVSVPPFAPCAWVCL